MSGGSFDSKAAGFTLPAGQDYPLGAVVLRLEIQDAANDPVVEVWDDNLGAPGASLVTLVNPPLPVSIDNFIFTPPAPFLLSASTTYWIVVWNASAGADSFLWRASSPGQTPTGIATSAGYLFDFGTPPPVTPSSTFNTYEVGDDTTLFADGFESGDTSAWSSVIGGG